MNKLIILLSALLFVGCKKNQSNNTDTKITDEVITTSEVTEMPLTPDVIEENEIFIDSTNFKYAKLDSFDLREFDWGERDRKFKFLTKNDFVKYFQDTELELDYVYEQNYHFFSLQKNEEAEKIITLIEENETCCAELHLMVYDKNNKLLSNNVVAGTGGDGGWYYDSYGYFANDSTYIKTKVDKEMIFENDNDSKHDVDSTYTEYKFIKNSTFKILTERTYKSTEIINSYTDTILPVAKMNLLYPEKNKEFQNFLNQFPKVYFPIKIKGCDNDFPNIKLLDKEISSDYEINPYYIYGQIPTNGDYIAIITIGAADCYLPVLTTYKLNGERIDQKTIAIGGCGSGPCFDCDELMTIDVNYNLYTANNFKYYDCDENYDEVSDKVTTEVIYRSGRLTENGIIELTEQLKKQNNRTNKFISTVDYHKFKIQKGQLGEVKLGMTISEAEKKLSGLRKEIGEATNFGYGGGSPAYLYYDKEELILGLIPKLDTDIVFLIVAVSPKLNTTNGLTPASTVEDISNKYPRIKVNQNLMNSWEEIWDTNNNWEFVFMTEDKTVGEYPELELPSELKNMDIKTDWITIK